ncbi:hypothetical protein GCM10027277_35660 [Pseudoduganella ginsengisoli]|uniref:Uncharacterized protein n=1 Tax=Pseudoduganella ginsengisoli TaxID=1462440 RepID=A0A6L6PYX6_9BURK|nr:hypothetical protein [Pseudoduganella ginsengisoli]MTW02188.1 hypothetical protein [Pseudoduganella ginsengisoli]
MNIAKNMEIIFVAAALVVGLTSEALARPAKRPATTLEQPSYVASPDIAGKVPVVVVSAKRLTAAEKAGFAG